MEREKTVSTEGYLAVPGAGAGPGVLVLHAWWGLNDTMKEVCERLARAGFVAFAPDLYHGQVATTIDQAERLVGAMDHEQADRDVAAAVDFLSQSTGDARQGLGVVGFSLGAAYAVQTAAEYPDRIEAVVLFYGTGEGDLNRSRAAFLGHFAQNDPYEQAEYVDALEATLHEAGRPVTFHRYDDVGHWFFEEDRPGAYDEPAARLAWERTLAFLRDRLA